jgi:hypothetical protein
MICYLCGDTIGERVSADHVPPKQFYAPRLRQDINLNQLQTLPTHAQCNRSYSHDEEYVVAAFVPLAKGTLAANRLFDHHVAKFRRGEMQGLMRKIIASFDRRPSGLVLPQGQVLMRVEGERAKRVVWKIVRGLFYLKYTKVLPVDTPYMVEVQEPASKAVSEYAEFWDEVKRQPSQGPYQGVFAFKYLEVSEAEDRLHLWGMLWWDKIIWFVAHDDPK